MVKRINVILSADTVSTIDRMTQPGERSRFIERAVQHYVATCSAEALHERLKQAALRDRDLDLDLTGDWFAADQEQWRKLDEQEKRQERTGRKGVKSTSSRSTRREDTKLRRPGPRWPPNTTPQTRTRRPPGRLPSLR